MLPHQRVSGSQSTRQYRDGDRVTDVAKGNAHVALQPYPFGPFYRRVTEPLAKGLVIPVFTWAVQLTVAALLFRGTKRYEYAVQLGVVCTLGSAALWPAALYNAIAEHPSPWVSAANVYASVLFMFIELRRRNRILGLPGYLAPVFLATIHVNMAIFATSALTPAFDGVFHRFW